MTIAKIGQRSGWIDMKLVRVACLFPFIEEHLTETDPHDKIRAARRIRQEKIKITLPLLDLGDFGERHIISPRTNKFHQREILIACAMVARRSPHCPGCHLTEPAGESAEKAFALTRFASLDETGIAAIQFASLESPFMAPPSQT